MEKKKIKIRGMSNIKSSSIKKHSMPKRSEDAGYLKMFVLSKEKEMLLTALNTLTEKRDTVIERLAVIKNEIDEKITEIRKSDTNGKESGIDADNKKKEFKKMKLNY